MMRLVLLAAGSALALARAGSPPTGSSVVSGSNVIWTDPTWKSDGTGAMPIAPKSTQKIIK